MHLPHAVDALPAARRAQKFPVLPLSGSSCRGSVGDHAPQTCILLLELLEALQLIPAHAPVLPAPPVIRLLRHADLAHRFGHAHAPTLQDFNLPQLRDDILGILWLPAISLSSNRRGKVTPVVDDFSGRTPKARSGTNQVLPRKAKTASSARMPGLNSVAFWDPASSAQSGD